MQTLLKELRTATVVLAMTVLWSMPLSAQIWCEPTGGPYCFWQGVGSCAQNFCYSDSNQYWWWSFDSGCWCVEESCRWWVYVPDQGEQCFVCTTDFIRGRSWA